MSLIKGRQRDSGKWALLQPIPVLTRKLSKQLVRWNFCFPPFDGAQNQWQRQDRNLIFFPNFSPDFSCLLFSYCFFMYRRFGHAIWISILPRLPLVRCCPPPAEHENVSLKLIPFSFGVVAIKRVRDFPFCSPSHRDYKSFLGAFNVAHAREAIAWTGRRWWRGRKRKFLMWIKHVVV